MSTNVVLVSLDWLRGKDPRRSLGHASIRARLLEAGGIDVTSVEFAVNATNFSRERVLVSVLDAIPDQRTYVAIGGYVWNEHIVRWLLAELRRSGFRGPIVLGGPQISYAPPGIDGTYPYADLFVRGYGEDALVRILRGEVSAVIRGMRQMASKRELRGQALKDVRTTCNYLENNAARMRYDVYLQAGYPIASGVIEGACRHVIKDRMEHGGMRWTLEGAQAMLDVRCVCASSEWERFGDWRQAEQAKRVHPFRAAVANYQGFKA